MESTHLCSEGNENVPPDSTEPVLPVHPPPPGGTLPMSFSLRQFLESANVQMQRREHQIGKFPAPPATMPEKQPHLGALKSAWKERQKSGAASPIKRGKNRQGTLGHLHPQRKGQIISKQPCRYQISGLEGGHKNRRAKGLSLGFCLPSRMFLWTSLAVQWLRFCVFHCGAHGFDPWLGKFRMPRPTNKQTKKNVSCYMDVVARE